MRTGLFYTCLCGSGLLHTFDPVSRIRNNADATFKMKELIVLGIMRIPFLKTNQNFQIRNKGRSGFSR